MSHKRTKFRFSITVDENVFANLIHEYAVVDSMKQFYIKDGIFYMNDSATGCQSLDYSIANGELILRAWIGGWNRPMPLSGKVNFLLISAFRNKLMNLITALQNAGAILLSEEDVEENYLLISNPSGNKQIIDLRKVNQEMNNNTTQYGSMQQAPNNNTQQFESAQQSEAPYAAPVNNAQSSGNYLYTGNYQSQNMQNTQGSGAFGELQEKELKRKILLTKIGFVMSILNTLLLLTGKSFLGGLGYLLIIGMGMQGLKTEKHKLAVSTIAISSITGILFLLLVIIGMFV